MLCNADVSGGVCRAPLSIVPQTYREVARLEPTDALERATNEALSQFVRLKQQLGTIDTNLKRAVSELQEGADHDHETQAAVVAISAQSIAQQLQELDGIFKGGGSTQLCGEKLRNVQHATVALCEAHQLRGSELQICALPGVSVERLGALLRPHGKEACRVWRGQWLAIRRLQQGILEELLPQAVTLIADELHEEAAFQAVTAMSAMDSASEAEAAVIEQLIADIELTSCQLLQQMRPLTGLPIQMMAQLTPKSRASLDNMLMQEREWAFNMEVNDEDLEGPWLSEQPCQPCVA